MSPLRLSPLVLLLTLACTATDDSDNRQIRETGFALCQTDAEDCDSGMRCTDEDGVSECVDKPADCGDTIDCACAAEVICDATRVCEATADGATLRCVEDDPPPPDDCEQLSTEACAGRADCEVVSGAAFDRYCIDEGNATFDTPLGCISPNGGGGGGAITCGQNSQSSERYFFPSTALPPGFEPCDDDQCAMAEPCFFISPEACASTPDCQVIEGTSIDDYCANLVNGWNLPLGCEDADAGGGDAETCAVDPDDGTRYMFPSTLVPRDWASCEGDVLCPECETDADQDGSCADVDCDDNDATRSPDLPENCGNGVDDDCNGIIDDRCAAIVACGPGVDCLQGQSCEQVGPVFTCTADLPQPFACTNVEELGFENECCTNADCGEGGHCRQFTYQYCGGPAPLDINVCDRPECSTDDDCNGGICLPAGVFGLTVPRCSFGDCSSDDDCGQGEDCTPYFAPCSRAFSGLHCAGDGDCRTDLDCTNGDSCQTGVCMEFIPPP